MTNPSTVTPANLTPSDLFSLLKKYSNAFISAYKGISPEEFNKLCRKDTQFRLHAALDLKDLIFITSILKEKVTT